MKLHLETVLPGTMKLLNQLMEIKELSQFRLVGGTALALQFGHRTSVDLDLFAGGRADISNLPKIINQHFKNAQLISKNQNGIMLSIDNTKVDIVDWKVPFTQEPIVVNGLRICSPLDIFANKCEAILNRRAEKDFVDIAVISTHFDLAVLFHVMKIRYPFITTGAITAFLLRRDLIVRDHSLQYFNNYNFDQCADLLHQKITEFLKGLKDRKELEEGERTRKIQDLINQKRNKEA